jgi:hypothetical protein
MHPNPGIKLYQETSFHFIPLDLFILLLSVAMPCV